MAFIRWIFNNYDEKAVTGLCEALDISRLAGAALVSRGITCADSAERFLGYEYPLGDGMLLSDMDEGVRRVRKAVEDGERIAVFGDYDVDGIMSTALFCIYLESAGADVVPFLPSRDCTGYGLVPASVDEIASEGATLIITVDNGVSSSEAVDYAAKKRIDTVICDHHIPPDNLPRAVAVIDPLRADDTSFFKSLAGVGVALKFVAAVEGCEVDEMLDQFGHFAAIGTVADVMPLVDENRVIVKQGLSQLAHGENPGFSALIEETGLDAENITAADVAYVIAPRLNAAGRMANAKIALRLLLTDDAGEAAMLAAELSELNSRRKEAEQELMTAVIKELSKDSEAVTKPMLVVSGRGFNSGVSGIVCSKLVERFGKPALIIAVDGEEARGSGRSLEGFSLFDAVESCGDLLISFGGHDHAVGFTISQDKIEEFKARLYEYCGSLRELVVCRSMRIDGTISFSDIGEKQVAELLKLAPFGAKNEEPVFATLAAGIVEIAPLGERHSKLTFEKDGAKLKAALFNTSPDELLFKLGDIVDIAYILSLYTPNERTCQVSAKLLSVVPAGFSNEDFDTIRVFDRMCFNQELSASEKAEIAPDREDVALVYRSVKAAPLEVASREQVCYRFNKIAPGKVLAAVEVLKELGLIVGMKDNTTRLVAAKNPSKRDLAHSDIYALLHSVRK